MHGNTKWASCYSQRNINAMKQIYILCALATLRQSLSHSSIVAFAAGGFGSKKAAAKSKKKSPKRRGLKEFDGPTQTQSSFPSTSKPAEGPKLDKWGLPIATLDDIFPPMGPETELIPVGVGEEYSLRQIQESLKDHFDLQLDRFFDDQGNERQKSTSVPMKVKLLHQSPPVLEITNFLTEAECEDLKRATSSAHQVDSATFAGAMSTRTSTSWFCHFADVPVLLAKANHILNIPLEAMEEPQIVRYKQGQEFSWHYDEVPPPQLTNGGQRLLTLLVYLNDVPENCGGGTVFRDLKVDGLPLTMQPTRGSALIFFPAYRDGQPDDRTLHKSEAMTYEGEKWITQMWVHQNTFDPILPTGNSKFEAKPKMEASLNELGYR